MGKSEYFTPRGKIFVRNLQLGVRITLEEYAFSESSDDFQFNALFKSENDQDFIFKKLSTFGNFEILEPKPILFLKVMSSMRWIQLKER